MEVRLSSWLAGTALMLILATYIPQCHGIGCFVCSSVNGSEPDCEDTFNNTGKFYRPDCMAGRKGRSGLFPGTDCVKMKATLGNFSVVVRDCSVDNGDLTSDSEMGRESHCWTIYKVKFNDVMMDGCLVACHTGGCNGATSWQSSSSLWWSVLLSLGSWGLVAMFGSLNR